MLRRAWFEYMKRIGILAGTFDPVHKGHISFALQAIEAAGLDRVYLLPEPLPRHKQDVTHVSHRIAMLKLATKAYPKISVLELPDKQFSIKSSLPRLKQKFPQEQLMLLIGTDVLGHISVWPFVQTMLKEIGLVVAVRGQKDERQAFQLLSQLPIEPPESHVIVSRYKMAAARTIRENLKSGEAAEHMLETVQLYVQEHWLYPAIQSKTGRKKN
jgi:nicotinate-nucleotide adenylyltransferase